MDYRLARRRGLNARRLPEAGKRRIERRHEDEILFFSSVAQLADELLNHGWKVTASRNSALCWTLDGCNIQVWIDDLAGTVRMLDKDSEDESQGRITDCFMIMGTLFVGMGVEI